LPCASRCTCSTSSSCNPAPTIMSTWQALPPSRSPPRYTYGPSLSPSLSLDPPDIILFYYFFVIFDDCINRWFGIFRIESSRESSDCRIASSALTLPATPAIRIPDDCIASSTSTPSHCIYIRCLESNKRVRSLSRVVVFRSPNDALTLALEMTRSSLIVR